METSFVPAIVTPFKEGSLSFDNENFKIYLKVSNGEETAKVIARMGVISKSWNMIMQ